MDERLRERLSKIDGRIKELRKVEGDFLLMQAHEKVMFAKLFLKESGSIEERKQRAYATQEWIDFSNGLAAAETLYLEQRRRYELSLKAYDAEHLTLKTETPAIKRQ